MSSTEEECCVVDWTNLPKELLDIILYKLIRLPDYIRFGAVCKAWLSVAVDQKQQRITNNVKEHPMLLINIPDKANDGYCDSKIKDSLFNSDSLFNFKLYSFSDDEAYSHKFQLPHRSRHLGSSHGWLAIRERYLSVTLINPFTGKNIHLPMIDRWPCGIVVKAILSCDPAKFPDDCVIAAIYNCSHDVAFIRPGEKSWTTAPDIISFGRVEDIIFHKRMLYALRRPQQLIAIDCGISSHSRNPNDQLPPTFEIVPKGHISRIPFRSCLVESLNGSLLVVREFSLLTQNPVLDFRFPVQFKVSKLVKRLIPSSNEEKSEWVEIQRLEKDEFILFGHTPSLCISASGFQNWHPNSIYFIHKSHSVNDHIGVFHLEDKRLEKFHRLNDSALEGYSLPIAWISPTLQ